MSECPFTSDGYLPIEDHGQNYVRPIQYDDMPNSDEPAERYSHVMEPDVPCGIVNLMTGEQCEFPRGHSDFGHAWEFRPPVDLVPTPTSSCPKCESPFHGLPCSRESTDAVTIISNDGTLIFRIGADGTILCPDPDRIAEAASVFWTEVTRMAQAAGWRVEWFQDGGSD